MVEDESDQRTYMEYVILVNFNGQVWTANQKYKTFCALHESLIKQYPSVTFPKTSYQFAQSIQSAGSSQVRAAERTRNLELYLQELALIPAIKESSQLKVFLGINQRYPQLYGSNNLESH